VVENPGVMVRTPHGEILRRGPYQDVPSRIAGISGRLLKNFGGKLAVIERKEAEKDNTPSTQGPCNARIAEDERSFEKAPPGWVGKKEDSARSSGVGRGGKKRSKGLVRPLAATESL